ncbi:xanthine dehydrogenase family protein molybdopterin-binding subunit [Hyphomicrobium sp.]|uniref:xanthine dehydrogenase family protein molybdopterin-binding subunit n=1 Tax=Hyphomicrobium sp. TaxID=82 RepID=UPI002D77BEF5|nr:xanthine dehydrogenase family protein molybdopterin-binding subunit [Hyphomicrobium sp.]HET6390417.1 xanthine dehydrogenase family protein molybdopterin-binding subunit [Hyphomicrobium sp.]
MQPAAPEPRQNQGQPAPRIDGRLKVTGEAPYAADIPLNNFAHAVLVTSPISHGEVTWMDFSEAKAVSGVLDIVTYGDMSGVKAPKYSNSTSTSLAPLHQKTIVHDGQIVALVVADTFEAASQAASLVRMTYAEQPASATLDSPGTETIPAAGVSPMYPEDLKAGDFEAAFASAPVQIDAEYATAPETHNPIELFSTTCAWTHDQLTVYEPTQNVYGFKAEIAKQLQLDPKNVRVVSPYVGGAFGSKGPMTPRTAIVAVAARRLNRPVRCVVTRMQGFTTTTFRAETKHRLRLGASRDGKFLAFSHEGTELTSRIDNYVVGGVDTTSRMYAYGAVASKVELVKADRQTPGYMRSPPETPYMFPLESAIDELAYKLDMDPVELRRLNDTHKDPISGKPYSSRSLMECYDEAAKAFGWSNRVKAPGSMRDGDWMIGWGCATAVYPTHVGAATARVRLSADGTADVQSASHEIGTGIRTVAAQMAAERLGLDITAVQCEMGDSDHPPAPVAGGSNSTASVCSTVLKACEGIRRRLFEAAVRSNDGPLVGKPIADLDLKNGEVVAKDGRSQKLSDVFKILGAGMVEEYAEFVPEGAPADAVHSLYTGKSTFVGGSHGKKLMYAFGAEFVEVRINARTREIRVPRMVGAFAAGRIMNTRTARSQLMGGMIWGMSSALLEETQVDPRNARYVNRELQDYLVPVNADIADVEVILVPEVDDEVNPAGIKGLGELGNVGTNAAIANAIFHATGKRIRHLPIRLEHLLEN